MTLLLIYAAITLGVSMLCSLLEASLLSLPAAHVSLMVEGKKRGGTILQSMQENIDEPLSAILTLNTIANTIGSAGVGAQALFLWGQLWLSIVSMTLTMLILVFSEILPKTVGARYTKGLATFTAYAVRVLILLTWPIVKILRLIASIVRRGGGAQETTREEVLITAKMALAQGVLRKKEYRVIRNLLRLDETTIKDVMTPRTVVKTLPEDITVSEALSQHGPFHFARMPVTRGDRNEIVGVVLRFSLLNAVSEGDGQQLVREICQPIHCMLKENAVGEAFSEFVKRREHLFLVVDEHGDMAGVISLEDVLEEMLGLQIQDETDPVRDMRAYARRLAEERTSRRKGRSVF